MWTALETGEGASAVASVRGEGYGSTAGEPDAGAASSLRVAPPKARQPRWAVAAGALVVGVVVFVAAMTAGKASAAARGGASALSSSRGVGGPKTASARPLNLARQDGGPGGAVDDDDSTSPEITTTTSSSDTDSSSSSISTVSSVGGGDSDDDDALSSIPTGSGSDDDGGLPDTSVEGADDSVPAPTPAHMPADSGGSGGPAPTPQHMPGDSGSGAVDDAPAYTHCGYDCMETNGASGDDDFGTSEVLADDAQKAKDGDVSEGSH